MKMAGSIVECAEAAQSAENEREKRRNETTKSPKPCTGVAGGKWLI